MPVHIRSWPDDWAVGPARPVTEIESENLYPDDGRVPHVPFGFNHAKWVAFKEKAAPGDTFHAFSSSPASWRALAGRAGYVLVRGDEAIDTFITRMN